MKKSGSRSLVQGVCVVAVLAAVGVPLSALMVGQTSAETTAAISRVAEVDVTGVESSESSSAVSALMSGSAVGPPRGCVVAPRHPASAYIP